MDYLNLESYSQVGDSDKFTYWLEWGSEDIGVISGAISSTKYGVWSRKIDKDGVSAQYDDNGDYKWAVKYGSGFFIYEVKPYQNVYACIRKALGQLTDYAFSKASTKPTHLIVVGTAKPLAKDLKYIEFLRSNLELPFTYECYSVDGDTCISYPIVHSTVNTHNLIYL